MTTAAPPFPAATPARRDRRTRLVLATAVTAAVAANAGAAWVYWHTTGTPDGTAAAVTLHGRSAAGRPPVPGQAGDLTVTVTNENPFGVRIRSVELGGEVVAEHPHRAGGCAGPAVAVLRRSLQVSWQVPRNSVGAFTVRRALEHIAAPAACAGAVYSVDVRATVTRRAD